jgi:hypothetical protein
MVLAIFCSDCETPKMQVLSYKEAAERAGIVQRSLERLIASGEGPAVVHMSQRRRGVLDCDLDRWLLSRRKAPPGETASTGEAS